MIAWAHVTDRALQAAIDKVEPYVVCHRWAANEWGEPRDFFEDGLFLLKEERGRRRGPVDEDSVWGPDDYEG